MRMYEGVHPSRWSCLQPRLPSSTSPNCKPDWYEDFMELEDEISRSSLGDGMDAEEPLGGYYSRISQ